MKNETTLCALRIPWGNRPALSQKQASAPMHMVVDEIPAPKMAIMAEIPCIPLMDAINNLPKQTLPFSCKSL